MIKRIAVLLFLLLFSSSCSTGQSYIKKNEIMSRSRKVAVLPFVNLTSHLHAGRIVGDLLTTELYIETEFQILDRTKVITTLKGKSDDLSQALERIIISKAAKKFDVDTIIYGSVTEYRYKRGLDQEPAVGINVRMYDAKTRKIIWAGSRSDYGGGFCGEKSLNKLALKVCRELVLEMVGS